MTSPWVMYDHSCHGQSRSWLVLVLRTFRGREGAVQYGHQPAPNPCFKEDTSGLYWELRLQVTV